MDTYTSDVEIGAGRSLRVTVTRKLSVARRWVNNLRHFHCRHLNNLQVGVGSYGNTANGVSVIDVSAGLHCLLLQLDATWVNVAGVFANFLGNPTYRFLGFHSEPVLGRNLDIPNYHHIINHGFEELVIGLEPRLIGDEYVHDAAQADTAWTRWPLT
ncbi:unnamed protein product [Brassica oleracea var. botrytis]|uniref:Uncharacterized protein n=2 Tax=Brassica TaxID=3705 RepID=A0A3P6ERP3_BRAOL|nr:hypothetical protein HID58_074091 [Brassica napus]CAF1948230.1 unnamed protein product [Brassica napus]VDD35172.1 unnamed protein product [Brassica oleracea]